MYFPAGLSRSLLIVVLAGVGCPATPDPPDAGEGEGEGEEPRGTVDLRVHVIGDFHGALEPPGPDVGGAAFLAAHLAERREGREHTLLVAAGDLIGASPLASAARHDEPTLEVMDALGLAASALGNHELDEGPAELLRLQNGGAHPDDDPASPWPGATFSYLAANVENDDGTPLLPGRMIVETGNARIGIVGIALENTPAVVVPSGTEGLTFFAEADAIRREAAALREAGADAVIALTHTAGGGFGTSCFVGPAADLADAVKDDVDLLVAGHSHATFACTQDGLPVIAAGSRGEVLGEIDLALDLDEGTVTAGAPDVHAVDHDVTPDPAVEAIVARAVDGAAATGNVVIGTLTAALTRAPTEAGESALGRFIADAQLASAAEEGAQVAFMNSGGLRADFTMEPSGAEAEGEVTYGEVFTVQPFSNQVMIFTITGAELEELLESQFTIGTQGIYQVAGIRYAWSDGAGVDDRVDPLSVFVNDAPLDLAADYRVVANSFLIGTPPFAAVRDVQAGVIDIDAAVAWFGLQSPVTPPADVRITIAP